MVPSLNLTLDESNRFMQLVSSCGFGPYRTENHMCKSFLPFQINVAVLVGRQVDEDLHDIARI